MLRCHEKAGFALQHSRLTFQMQGARAQAVSWGWLLLEINMMIFNYYLLCTSAVITSASFGIPLSWEENIPVVLITCKLPWDNTSPSKQKSCIIPELAAPGIGWCLEPEPCTGHRKQSWRVSVNPKTQRAPSLSPVSVWKRILYRAHSGWEHLYRFEAIRLLSI